MPLVCRKPIRPILTLKTEKIPITLYEPESKDISPEELQKMCEAQQELAKIKINSATHKCEWNYLYRLTTPNAKGQAKCDVDIYNKWHAGR